MYPRHWCGDCGLIAVVAADAASPPDAGDSGLLPGTPVPSPNTMRVTRISNDSAGESRFEDVEIPLRNAGEIGRLSEAFGAHSVIFRETAPDYDYDWHPAPQRQLIVLLDGAIEIEVGSGEKRRFQGGDLLLVEDTEGRGHRTRTIDGRARRSLFIPLAAGTDF